MSQEGFICVCKETERMGTQNSYITIITINGKNRNKENIKQSQIVVCESWLLKINQSIHWIFFF